MYENIGSQEPQWIELDSILPRSQVPATILLSTEVQGISVFADPMLEKVFFNLLDNAIRHGGRVTGIRVSSRREGSDLVVVWEDNGIGITADEKDHIFERGFGKNTGLGMFLAREVLALTGITIAETGEQGKGARFEIVVPEGLWREL
jgi:signal transduction histidine kinase